MKTIGMVLAFVACATMGWLSASRTKGRERMLAAVRADWTVLRRAVEQDRLPLQQAVKRLPKGALSDFTECYLERLETFAEGDEAFHAAWNETLWELSLKERTAFFLYCKTLRQGDRMGVRAAGEQLSLELEEASKEAEAEAKQGKVYRTVGVLSGAALVIMML